jgi:hypothetical protein
MHPILIVVITYLHEAFRIVFDMTIKRAQIAKSTPGSNDNHHVCTSLFCCKPNVRSVLPFFGPPHHSGQHWEHE